MATRILVVEDNPDLHLGLALRLKSAGYTVLSALNGDEAIALARNERPDLILMDIGLPGMSGHTVADNLLMTDETRFIPIVYLTGRHEYKHRLRASEHGASAYLVKPCTPGQLLRTIQSVLHPNEAEVAQ